MRTAGPGMEWRSRNIGRLLLCAADAFVTDKLREVERGEFGPVTQVHIALIQNLDLHGTRLTLIADRARMTKQSMLELVDKAERLRFVERRPDPADGRAKIVTFTPDGLRMMRQLRDGIAQAERHMADVTGAAFVARLKRKLAAYVSESAGAVAGGLAMSPANAEWRLQNAGRMLGSAFRVFSGEVTQAIRGGGFGAVSEVHMTLFRNLDLAGTRPTQLAARARMTKQAMADLVAKTEVMGLVARMPDPSDGRAKTVALTEAGLRMIVQAGAAVEQAERRLSTVTGDAFLAEMRERLAAYIVGRAETLAELGELAPQQTAARMGDMDSAARDAAHALGRSPRSSRMMRSG